MAITILPKFELKIIQAQFARIRDAQLTKGSLIHQEGNMNWGTDPSKQGNCWHLHQTESKLNEYIKWKLSLIDVD